MHSFLLQFEEPCSIDNENILGTETFTKAEGGDSDRDNELSIFAGTKTFTEAKEEPDQDESNVSIFG